MVWRPASCVGSGKGDLGCPATQRTRAHVQWPCNAKHTISIHLPDPACNTAHTRSAFTYLRCPASQHTHDQSRPYQDAHLEPRQPSPRLRWTLPCGAPTCTAPPAEGGGAVQKGGVVVGTAVYMYSQRILNSRLVFVICTGLGTCWCGPVVGSQTPCEPSSTIVQRALSPSFCRALQRGKRHCGSCDTPGGVKHHCVLW